MNQKINVEHLALFGGKHLFATFKPTGQLAKPNHDVFFEYLQKIYKSRWCTNNGPIVQILEQRLASMHQVGHCVAFANASMALIAAMHALAHQPNEVIMPAFTYVGLPHLARWAGHRPVFCDVREETHGIDPDGVRKLINKNTALILAVNNVNSTADIHVLQDLTEAYGIPLLFDSVYGLGGTYKGTPLGGFGSAEVFSLHATKLINGFEGGYVTTNDGVLAAELRVVRSFGFSCRDTVSALGFNAKMNEVHAASALSVLDDLDIILRRNEDIFSSYLMEFEGVPGVSFLKPSPNERHNYELCIMELGEKWPFLRHETLSLLRAESILARPYYSPPLHHDPVNCAEEVRPILPVTDKVTKRFLQMPVGSLVSNDDIHKMAGLFRFLYENRSGIIERLRREK